MDEARKKNIFLIHLETQYAKTDCRNEIYTKNWVRRTWPGKKSTGRSTVKVNGQCSVNAGQRSTVKVNGQRSMVNSQRLEMTSADQWMLTQLGLTWQCVEARGGVCGLRWRRDIHECVDRRWTISVVPSKVKSEQYSQR